MSLDLVRAEQQLTGFNHAYHGYGIISLVEDMGLRAEEWDELREDVPWFPEHLKREIDHYFENQK